MKSQSIDKRAGLSIFQSLFISYLGIGLLVFAILGTMFYWREKEDTRKELKTQLQHELEHAVNYFDKTYTTEIKEDLNYIDRAYSFNTFLSSPNAEIPFTRTLAEQLFLNFTNRSKGMYLSARYIDAQGNEQVITSGNKRIRTYKSLGHGPGDTLYAHLNTLFRRLKSAKLGAILFEGPFKCSNRSTFLIGISKTDPEIGGLSGVVILHCDLTDYFDYLDKYVLYREHEAEVLSLDNNLLFSPRNEDNVLVKKSKPPDFYSVSQVVRMGSDNESFLKIKFDISSDVLRKHMEETFRYSFVWIFLIILPIGVIAFFISGYFSKPLIDLTDVVNRFAKGDLFLRARINATGELKTLVSSFNNMAEDLEKITVSRDDLVEEINKRKRTEEELKKSYNDLKSIQVQLLQSEKMASIGQLAAGVAHEINNPVGFIGNNMEILKEYVGNYTSLLRNMEEVEQQVAAGDLEKAKAAVNELKKFEEEIDLGFMMKDISKLVDQCGQGLERIQKIVMDLRTFSRVEKVDNTEPIKIEEIIDNILSIVQNELKYKAELVKEYGQTPLVMGSPQRLGQVLINLLVNAAQSIQQWGKISIKTYQQQDYVCIDISDTGNGIAEENLKKIFDPFFTTKPVGQGTGLGLSVSHEIIQKHGGEIKVTSKMGEGTTFTVMLPITSNNPQ